MYVKIKDWQGEWKEVEDKFRAIEKDIKHFGMTMPDFGKYQQIRRKLQKN